MTTPDETPDESPDETPDESPDKKYGVSVRLEATPARVWKALTETDELLAWLGHEVAIELREGGALQLKTGTPLLSGDHAITAFDPERSLTLRWTFQSVATTVQWRLEPDDGGTTVAIVHSIPAGAPVEIDDPLGGEGGVLLELWAYVGGLLKTWIELGEAKCRLDAARTPENAVRHELTIAAEPRRVFEALVEPEVMKSWNAYAPAPAVEKRVGGRYSFGWKSEQTQTDGPGELVEYEDGHKITYTWYGKDKQTLVSWEVEPLPGTPTQTRVRFVHSGFVQDQNMLVGWNLGWAGFLASLALALERGTDPRWLGEAA